MKKYILTIIILIILLKTVLAGGTCSCTIKRCYCSGIECKKSGTVNINSDCDPGDYGVCDVSVCSAPYPTCLCGSPYNCRTIDCSCACTPEFSTYGVVLVVLGIFGTSLFFYKKIRE